MAGRVTIVRHPAALRSPGRVLADVDHASMWGGCGPCVGLRRAALHRALHEAAGPVRHGVTITAMVGAAEFKPATARV
jgi:hypothetical protein